MEQSTPPAGATTVLVVAGARFNAARRAENEVLHTERDPEVVARLATVLSDLGDEVFDWMEWPRFCLVFLAGDVPLAQFGVLSGATWVRTTADEDREVLQAEELGAWLTSAGVAY